jgi:hypothetical protein
MNLRNERTADGLRPRALIASPFFERAMTTPCSDRRTMILNGLIVNVLDRVQRDPG